MKLIGLESSRHGALSGIKRLGTVMGRRKSQAPPPSTASPEKSKKSRGFAPFRREDSSNSFHQMDSPPAHPRELTPVTSRDQVLSPQTSAPQALQEPLRPAAIQPPVPSHPTDPNPDEITPAPPLTNGAVAHKAISRPPQAVQQQTPSSIAAPVPQHASRLDAISQAQEEAAAATEYNG